MATEVRPLGDIAQFIQTVFQSGANITAAITGQPTQEQLDLKKFQNQLALQQEMQAASQRQTFLLLGGGVAVGLIFLIALKRHT